MDHDILITSQLEWVQPKTPERRYLLYAGEQAIASLEFKSPWGSLALASFGDQHWTFKRVGFFNTRVTVRREGEGMELAIYHPKWTGSEGKLEIAGGHSYHWKTANFWATRFLLADTQGQTLISYQSGREDSKLSDLFKSQARVEVDPARHDLPELPLLILLTWYLILLQQEDSSAAVAATAAT